jgi:type I restriction enzyme S subunit
MEEKQVNIPDGWKLNKLGAVCRIKKGIQFNRIELSDSGMYPCINGGIEPSGYSDLWNTNENTITISEGGNSCGFVNLIKTKFWSGGHCYSLLDLKSDMENDFLYQALKGRQNLIMDLRVGSGLPNIQQKAIKEFEFLSPENPTEQTTIARILSKVDEAIAQTEQLIAKYTRIKTGLMQDLLTKGIDEHGNIRSEETHEFKDSPLGRIPKEWECLTIGDIAERLRSGVTPKGGSDVYQKEGIMLIRSQNVYSYGFKLDDIAYISEEINSRMLGSQLQAFDVLLNITGASIGRSTFLPENHPLSNVNQHVCAIRLKNTSLEKAIYLSSFLNSVYGQNQIEQNNAGSNREGINYNQIRAILIPWFKREREFESFKNIISKTNEKIESLNISLFKLQSLKTGLMQDLLSGKVRVNHLIKETARV